MIPRRQFLAVLPVAAVSLRYAHARPTAPSRILFGTQSVGASRGIYIATWNAATGEIGPLSLAAEANNATWLATYPSAKGLFVFCVCEVPKGVGSVRSFLLEPGSSTLTPISTQNTLGNGPTHLSVHPNGRSLYVANYGGGSISSFHIRPDGTLSPAVSHIQYKGHGPNANRQEMPHAHSAQVSPDGRFLLVNDLGLDRIVLYRINDATAELTPHEPEYWGAKFGSGPRHIVFSPNGKFVYCVSELTSSVEVLAWDAKQGTLTTLGSSSLIPDGFPQDKAHASEVSITRKGDFLYVNNRGGEIPVPDVTETIIGFTIDKKTGLLTKFGTYSNGGVNTRYITLSPDERFMIACNQDSGGIAVIPRNKQNGKLAEPLKVYPLERAMFATFI